MKVFLFPLKERGSRNTELKPHIGLK